MNLVNIDTGEVLPQLSPADARVLTDRIKVGVEAVWHLIADAYQGRAWAALGHASWDEYITREFGVSRLRLPREERQEVVASLREQGLSVRAIAAATGDSHMTIQRDLSRVPDVTPDPAEDEVLDAEIVEPPTPKPITGTDGKTYKPSAPKPRTDPTPAPITEPSHLTPDTKNSDRWGKGVTANTLVAQKTARVLADAESLLDHIEPEDWRQVARPGDLNRWADQLRDAADLIKTCLKKLEA